jgi:DNA mismatch repair protein MutS
MRQVALISLLAHMGAFVPAKKAKIGLIDRIATRVGASDRIGRGQSTFMVEMNEMARILRQASEKSLLIIDEIGRGTSTYDGLALAWAIVGDIQSRIGARTLFATHYHELTKLEGQLQGVLNYSVLVEERAGDILFLHKVALGKAPGSYGVQVAKLAGLPANIIEQARSILQNLEQSAAKKADRAIAQSSQLSLFDSSPKIVKEVVKEIPMHMQQLESELLQIDLDQTTPLNALIALRNLKDKVNQKKP